MQNESTAYVTGATGWLGSRLMVSLNAQHSIQRKASRFTKIKCFVQADSDLGSIDLPFSDYEVVRGDIRNPDDVDRFLKGANGGTVFHCAGLIHPALRIRDLFTINACGAQNLADAAAASGVKRVVAVSSNSVTGASTNKALVYNESSQPDPHMAYGRSKLRMENILDTAAKMHDFEVVTLKVPWFYGPNQPDRQSQFFSMIRNGSVPVVGAGDNLRSLAYVDEIATALILGASDSASSGSKYWISDRKPYRYNEIIETIETVLENDFNIEVTHARRKLPSAFGNIARVSDRLIQAFGFYNQKIHVAGELNMHIVCDPSLAISELGFEPLIGLREGMRRSIESCLARGHNI